jgi:NADH-quinone oxidoreductase subunit L
VRDAHRCDADRRGVEARVRHHRLSRSDEAYDRLITRPLYWISDRVFLRLGDQRILDGSLNGLAALGQRGAALLSRIQTGSLHLYALLVVAGIVASLAWSWRHG